MAGLVLAKRVLVPLLDNTDFKYIQHRGNSKNNLGQNAILSVGIEISGHF